MNKAKLTAIEREILERLKDLDLRLSVLERLPTPIVFAIGQKFPSPLEADMYPPSELEH